MKPKHIRRVFIALLISFVIIFLLRFLYELSYYAIYVTGGEGERFNMLVSAYSSEPSSQMWTKNFVSERQIVPNQDGAAVDYEQKYEMVADIKAHSDSFEEDERTFRQAVRDVGGVVQYERSYGLPGERELTIAAGVAPGKFDGLVDRVKGIGNTASFSVDKTDKTGEFRAYLAQREALEKSLDTYVRMKAKGGEVSDLLIIEEKISEIEQKLRETGVALGVFDESQSMCTVQFALSESKQVQKAGVSFDIVAECAAEALPWALSFYLCALLFVIGTAFSAVGITFVAYRIVTPRQNAPKGSGEADVPKDLPPAE